MYLCRVFFIHIFAGCSVLFKIIFKGVLDKIMSLPGIAPFVLPYIEEVRIMYVSYLIFVTDTRTVSVEKKSVMWRNFKFLYMTDEEKSKISPHVD